MTFVEPSQAWMAVAYALIAFGLVGAVIPVLPGPMLIWLGTFVFAWADGFARIGWGTLILLGLLAVISWGSDIFLSTVMSRRAGASWKAIIGAIVGGLLGAPLLSLLPLLGTILGAILGAIAGMWVVEYWDKRNASAATSAVQAYIASIIFAAILEFFIALVMVGIFAAQVFYFPN